MKDTYPTDKRLNQSRPNDRSIVAAFEARHVLYSRPTTLGKEHIRTSAYQLDVQSLEYSKTIGGVPWRN